MKSFLDFISSRRTYENSDLDWSDKNWGEAGMDAENPHNSSLEGTSAEPMDYTAVAYGKTADEDSNGDLPDDEITDEDLDKASDKIDSVKALLDDLTTRVTKLEKNKTK